MNSFEALQTNYGKFKETYGKALLSCSMVRENGREGLLYGSLVFLRDDIETQEGILDYGQLLLRKMVLKPDDAFDIIKSLMNKIAPAGHDFSMGEPLLFLAPWCYINWPLVPLGQQRFFPWPSQQWELRDSTVRHNVPNGPFASAKLPLVIDVKSTISRWVGFDVSRSSQQGSLIVIMPDYRARISKVQFGDKEVTVAVEPGISEDNQLIAKAAVNEMEVQVKKRKRRHYIVQYDEIPSSFNFFLLDRERDELIDWARISPNWTSLPPEVGFVSSRLKIEHLIDGGESETVEFKKEIGDGHTLVQSVVGFANTNGGFILVGVEDNSFICGTDPEKDIDKIREWIENKCEPPISIEFEKVNIDGKKVLVLSVPKGENPPYQHRGNGIFYIRRGATDRPMRRIELDRIKEIGGNRW